MPNLGMNKSPVSRRTGLADALFSGSQQRLLGLLFGQPSRSFYATESRVLAQPKVWIIGAESDLGL